MEPGNIAIQLGVPVMLLALFIIVGIPIAFAIGLASMISLVGFFGTEVALHYLATVPYRQASNFSLISIPLFLLMGEFCLRGGVSELAFKVVHKWMGHLPGGLAMAAVVASGIFGAISGSSTASVAAIGPMATTEMKRYKYDMGLAMGSVAASGTFANMIPPSIAFIVYGILTGVSIGKLFMAGIVPGVLAVFSFIIFIAVRVKLKPALAPRGPVTTWRTRITSLGDVWPFMILIFLVLGTIYLGIATPSEAAALARVGALVIVLAKRPSLTRPQFTKAVGESVRTAAMIFLFIIMAYLLSHYLSISRVPDRLAALIVGLGVSKWMVISVIMVLYLVLGCFLTGTEMMVLTLPVLFPVITSLGINPVYFGVLVVKNIEIGLLTPPVGLNLFVIQAVTGERLERVIAGVLPFLIPDFILLIILMLVPELSLFIPNHMGG